MSHKVDAFERTIQKTNEILGNIEAELGWEKRRDQTYNAFRVVLHALRDRLPFAEAFHLSAQLPLLVKGVYVDSWDPLKNPIKMEKEEFLNRIRSEFPIEVEGDTERLVRVVLDAIFESIDPHESKKLKQVLPKDIRDLFD